MSTAVSPTQTIIPALIQAAPRKPTAVSKFELRQSWEDYQKNAEPRGLAFGKLCYEFRQQSEVVQGGTTFTQTLADLGIPRRTAYYWMERYEELIGERQPRVETEVEAEPETELKESETLSNQNASIESPADPAASPQVPQLPQVPLPEKSPVRQEAVINLKEGRIKWKSVTYKTTATPELKELQGTLCIVVPVVVVPVEVA